jgi:nucleoside-diphosphate-sugar epimerase
MGNQESQTGVLVTGGGGFVGSALVRRLVESGYRVTSFSRGDYPELRKLGVIIIRGDLNNRLEVLKAAEGQSIVIHAGALAGFWGSAGAYEKTNVQGTNHIIEACLKNNVDKLIYTSTASTVFGGKSIVNGGQDLHYPERSLSHYCRTKALAERSVLNANGGSLRTISLRPHIVTGPGDNHIIPRLIERAEKGRLRIIGNGSNFIDTVFIDNLVDAHMLAIQALDGNPVCRGQAYFITNGEPVNLWDFVNLILEGTGLPPVTKRIPYRVALPLSSILSGVYKLIPSLGEPLLTPFLVRELAQSHWFDPGPARRDLGYSPSISTQEGLMILIRHLKNRT